MLESLRAAYAMIDQMNITITGLIAIVSVLALAFLFSVREASSWFFKIDDIKRDVRSVRDLVLQLEGEIKTLQEMISQGKKLQSTDEKIHEETRLVKVLHPRANEETVQSSRSHKPSHFPITH